MLVCGIDPGLSGAIAFLDTSEGFPGKLSIQPMPTEKVNAKKRRVNAFRLHDILRYDPTCPDLVVIEDVGTQPGWGAAQCFSFGHGVGSVHAILQIECLTTRWVKPQEWKAQVLKGTDKSKEAAIAFIKWLFPKVSLIPPASKNESHDYAEAACLALYGAMHHDR